MALNINLLPDEVIARGITPPDISKLPEAFWSGQERGLFGGGLPRDAQGNIDYNKMAEMLAQVQGAGAIPTLAALRQADIQQQALTGLDRLGPQIFGTPGAVQQQTLPPSIQRTSGVPQTPEPPSGEPLRPGQQGNLGEVTGVTIDGKPTEAPSFASRFAGEPPASTAYPPQFSQTPDTGPPIGGFTQVAEAPQARQQQPPPPPTQSPAPPGSPGFFSEQNAAAYEQAAQRANYMATRLGLGGVAMAPAAQRLGAQAQQYFDTAKQIREQIGKTLEPTPEIKAYRLGMQPGETLPEYQARSKGMETASTEDVKDFRKKNEAIQSVGSAAINGLQKAQLAKNLTLDPNFYSGPLQQQVQSYRQFQAIFGNNPSSALPQEAFNKEVSDLLQEQIKAMAGSGVGRVFVSEVQIMKKAVASLGITPQTNRALLEMLSRVYQQQQDIADVASRVNVPPGQMSNALDSAIRAHIQTHPLFTPQELRNPTLLGAPDMPPASVRWTPQQARAHAQSLGLNSGDWVRVNGQLVQVP